MSHQSSECEVEEHRLQWKWLKDRYAELDECYVRCAPLESGDDFSIVPFTVIAPGSKRSFLECAAILLDSCAAEARSIRERHGPMSQLSGPLKDMTDAVKESLLGFEFDAPFDPANYGDGHYLQGRLQRYFVKRGELPQRPRNLKKSTLSWDGCRFPSPERSRPQSSLYAASGLHSTGSGSRESSDISTQRLTGYLPISNPVDPNLTYGGYPIQSNNLPVRHLSPPRSSTDAAPKPTQMQRFRQFLSRGGPKDQHLYPEPRPPFDPFNPPNTISFQMPSKGQRLRTTLSKGLQRVRRPLRPVKAQSAHLASHHGASDDSRTQPSSQRHRNIKRSSGV